MNRKKNFLLGYGERLTRPIPPIQGGGEKSHPYSFEEAVLRLSPKALSLSKALDKLPKEACPHDEAVGIITLHPAYIAKSYYPESLFQTTGLRSVGSKTAFVRPEKWKANKIIEPVSTVEIFVAGKRDLFKRFAENLVENKYSNISQEIIRVENIRYFMPGERVKKIPKKGNINLEIALHAQSSIDSEYILSGFERYLNKLDVFLDLDRRISTIGLCFIPALATYDIIDKIEKFSFLRIIREMPKLRAFTPFLRSNGLNFKCELPNDTAIDPSLSAAIFDGGIATSQVDKWVNRKKSGKLSNSFKAGTDHGLAVTSAVLFGPIVKGKPLSRPYSNVDHYRVLDDKINVGDDLFDVLPRIMDVLHRGKHEFINLSIGPDIPIEDNDVEVWTSVLDEFLSRGQVLAAIAVGNNGELDEASGNARVMVPSDCVNGMSVGACDILSESKWKRASYSCLGPGRSPGIVKPDVVAFGGSTKEPYFVLDTDSLGNAVPVRGTSFAAPTALRMAIGIRSHFGRVLSPLAIKGLLINKSRNLGHEQKEVGWGRIPNNLEDIVMCRDGEVTVVYQGELEPSKFIRASIPIPEIVTGNVTITATLCFATDIDPQDICSYTRSGVEVMFRPHKDKYGKDEDGAPSKHQKTSPFFTQSKLYRTESELRQDAHKWETVLHSSVNKFSSSLKNPVFDIHYISRTAGGTAINPKLIPYALVINILAPKDRNIYDKVLRRYRSELEALLPVIEIPIQV